MANLETSDEGVGQDPNFATDFELGQDNIRPFGLDIHNPVFVISSVLIIAFVVLAIKN